MEKLAGWMLMGGITLFYITFKIYPMFIRRRCIALGLQPESISPAGMIALRQTGLIWHFYIALGVAILLIIGGTIILS
ncbi:hypothetical protein SAMN02745857_02167 [Andreprevotia lacus DSM 23236]|jgi:hypothetical protein|uniref:Uncharacterized protein n=1 Tax=Andreprevotia lacus DSM 23236 TaxID=1121001 RepID=A0A1W1XNJ0_9NEIS|nr:hypothetical protein [Andreprevotia lacus]SMC25437.1 hypothetical protein SAMN02745857_02167 [Andreprevotia lacus DSM 23236]